MSGALVNGALILGAYLLGAISFSVLVVRRTHRVDVRTVGSGNAGATNVFRVGGSGPALLVLLLDLAKGALPVALARALGAPGPVVGAVAVATVVGHVYPVYHGFRGGKGVATVTGALCVLAPLPTALSIATFVVLVAWTRYVAVGSMSGVCLFPLYAYLCGRLGWTSPAPTWLLLSAAALAVLIVGRHLENIRRIREGGEWKLGDPRGEEQGA